MSDVDLDSGRHERAGSVETPASRPARSGSGAMSRVSDDSDSASSSTGKLRAPSRSSERTSKGPARGKRQSWLARLARRSARSASGSSPYIDNLGHKLHHALLDNAALKFVALVLSVTLFILVNTNKDALIGVDVRVVYTMPENRVLVSDKTDQVRVTIKGSWRRVKRFDEREMERIHVDLTNLRSGEYRFPEDAIRLPPGLTLLAIEPASMMLRFEPLRQATVPVHVPTLGRPLRGYKLERLVAKPTQVTIRGAESVISEVERVSSRPLSLDGRSQSFAETLSLVAPRPAPVFQVVDGEVVDVEVEISQERGSRSFEGVPIDIRPGPGVNPAVKNRLTVKPATVDVTLHGPLLTVERFSGKLVAVVEVYAEDLSGRPRNAPLYIENAPEGVGVEIRPETATVKANRPQ